MTAEIINHPQQTKLQLTETVAVLSGARFLQSLRLKGWPRKFECAQDKAIAHRLSDAIGEARDYYFEQLRPAEPTYILGKIEILESRYFEKSLDDFTEKELAKEWIEDLAEYPADLIDLACRNWRRANQNYAPRSAGVLMESVKAEFIRRRCILKNAETVLGIIT